jgi:DNA-binding response OmpR family regulator
MTRILIAEDDTLFLEAIQDTLELDGYSVYGVTNGVQAAEAFSHFRPDLIIADVSMPEMGGFELYHWVRYESPGTTIPFIFVSAREVAQDVEQLSWNNCVYLRKPFKPKKLLEAMRKFLG